MKFRTFWTNRVNLDPVRKLKILCSMKIIVTVIPFIAGTLRIVSINLVKTLSKLAIWGRTGTIGTTAHGYLENWLRYLEKSWKSEETCCHSDPSKKKKEKKKKYVSFFLYYNYCFTISNSYWSEYFAPTLSKVTWLLPGKFYKMKNAG